MSCAARHSTARWEAPTTSRRVDASYSSSGRAGGPPPARRRRRVAVQAAAAAGGVPPAARAASSSSSSDVTQLKQDLLQAISRSNNPRPGDSLLQLEREVEAAAETLAAANPTPATAASPLLTGTWALLFSGRSRRLAAAAAFPSSSSAGPSLQEALQAASDAAYSTFYQYLPVLAGSAVGSRRGGGSASNLQVLRPGRVDNIVSTRGRLPLRLCVSGSVDVVQPPGGAPASCVAVRFDRFTVKAGALPEAALSLGWLRPLGYVATLFLDEEMRVSVGDKGGLFVLRRVAGEGGEGGERGA